MTAPTASRPATDAMRPVYVVTGASRGLGRATATHLASGHSGLAICARTKDALDATAETCRALGSTVHAEVLDVADADAVRAFADRVEDRLGPARGLVNNAGVLGPVGPIDRVDMDEWREALLVNVAGVANACAGFVPQMRRSGGGSIVNLSGGGLGGPVVQSFLSAYTSSKAAVAVLTETLAAELVADGIRVNAVAPGGLATELMRPVLTAGREAAGEALYSTAVRIYEAGSASDDVPVEFATLLDFLLSPGSAWLTGRLLSARWETVERLLDARDRISTTSLFALRRIDDALYTELPTESR